MRHLSHCSFLPADKNPHLHFSALILFVRLNLKQEPDGYGFCFRGECQNDPVLSRGSFCPMLIQTACASPRDTRTQPSLKSVHHFVPHYVRHASLLLIKSSRLIFLHPPLWGKKEEGAIWIEKKTESRGICRTGKCEKKEKWKDRVQWRRQRH